MVAHVREGYGDSVRRESGPKVAVFMTLCNGLSAPCAIKGGRRDIEKGTISEEEVLLV